MNKTQSIVITPSAGYLLPFDAACKIAELLADARPVATSYDAMTGYTLCEQDRYSVISVIPLTVTALAELELGTPS